MGRGIIFGNWRIGDTDAVSHPRIHLCDVTDITEGRDGTDRGVGGGDISDSPICLRVQVIQMLFFLSVFIFRVVHPFIQRDTVVALI